VSKEYWPFLNRLQSFDGFWEEYPGSRQIYTVYFNLGQAYEIKGDYEKAINAFKEIKEKVADREIYSKARLAIANIFSHDLEPQSAIATYQKIIESSPEFQRDALVKIAEVHKTTKEFEKAIKVYKKAIRSSEDISNFSDAEIQFYIGDSYELLNKPEKAVEEYFKIPYLYSDKTEWVIKTYLRIARIFEDQEKWEDANSIYNKVVEYKTVEIKFAQERLEWIAENTIAEYKDFQY